MPTEVIFTALPAGRDPDGRLHLSVHVSPRLTTAGGADATLADFPDLLDWPPSDLSFQVEFRLAGTRRGHVQPAADPSLWPKLFPATSLVRSQDFGGDNFPDYSGEPIHTYPATKVASWLAEQYAQVAIDSPEFYPEIEDLLAGGFDDIRFSGRDDGVPRFRAAMDAIEERLAREGVVDTRAPAPPGIAAATFDFVQLLDFFAPLDTDDPDVREALAEPVAPPSLDFHAAVAFCNQHPTLQRLLGLVFDLVVDDEDDSYPDHDDAVRVVPAAGALAAPTVVRTPFMHFTIDHDRFAAVPRPTADHFAEGFLRLEDTSQFETIVVDAEGSGLKAVDFAANLWRRQHRRTVDTPTDSSLPALRANGLAVALKGNAKLLKEALARGAQHLADLAADDLDLWADDVVRGYRLDVWDSMSGAWHSLMHRQGQYELEGGATTVTVTDEAFLVESTTKKPRSRDLYQPETLFSWDGWSLAVARPGKTHNTDPQGDPLIAQPDDAPTDFDARFDFGIVAGTLPRLRYGVDYRFRARTVDLAGNSVAPDSTDAGHATPATRFGRLEPAQSPPVVLRTPRGPGESMETVVLRSNFDIAPPVPTAERHITPAKVGQRTVELHGLLDVPDPGDDSLLVLDKTAYEDLADRDAANLANHGDAEVDPADRADPDGARFYDVDQLALTWAPDPAAFRFAFRLLDGPHADFLETYSFEDPLAAGSWGDLQTVRLVVVEDTGEPTFDPSDHLLRVPLGKGDVVHARLSAVVPPLELHKYGLWQWIVDSGATFAQLSALNNLVGRGQHWMFEPFRILTLVHAVRQPLLPPEFPEFTVNRELGDTWAGIGLAMQFSRTSTSKVDILASWREPVDLGPGTGTPLDAGAKDAVAVERATAFVLDIEHGDDPSDLLVTLPDPDRHEFGDTRHRMVTYRGVATTRFGEFFTDRAELEWDPQMVADPPQVVVLDTGGVGVVAASVKITHYPPPPPDPDDDPTEPQHLVEDEHFTVHGESGTITFVAEGIAQLAHPPEPDDPVIVVFLTPPVTRETPDPPGDDEIGPRLMNVPSSARPAAPRVLYALPTFGWETEETTAGGSVQLHSTRRGNGVRVYLERPWWSSGDGELLGVVTWPLAELADPPDLEDPSDPTEDADPRRPYVTQWGEDPVYGSRVLPHRYPRMSSFPDRVDVATGLTLAELDSLPGLGVNVAAHRVAFDPDPDRDLWYCDLTVDAGSAYTPLVRLALARYQPSSIVHAHLSRVVLADFVQLAPDRFATVVLDPSDDTKMTVTLTGPTHTQTEASQDLYPGAAHVIIEQNTGIQGDLKWQQQGAPVEMTAGFVRAGGHWTAEVQLPGPRTPNTWRLVIEQSELLGAEPLSPSSGGTVPDPVPRLVHTDVIEL